MAGITSYDFRVEIYEAESNAPPAYLYEGCAEDYEDLADIIAVPLRSLPKGVRIA